MNRLCELAPCYLEAAARLRGGIRRTKEKLETADSREKARLAHDLALMEVMLREMREVGSLVQHYYEPGYCRDRRYIQ